jgi:hypothetical protein
MTKEEIQELRQLLQGYYSADKNNRLVYFYKVCTGKRPPSCQCEYGNMFNELKQWLSTQK